jgi:acetyl esterase/lipase
MRAVFVAGALACACPAAGQQRVVPDVDYLPAADHAGGKDRLDIYVPDAAKRAPVIFSIHGGALSQGDRKEEVFVGRRFAEAGYVTVIPSYRLSPSVSHPAHIQDVAAAFAWVRTRIADHGGDPDRIFVIGHSAGAYLAALLVSDPQYLAAHKLAPSHIRAVVPVSGFFWVDRKGVAPDRPKHVWGTNQETWRAASPARYLQGPRPPMLLLYADGDEEWRRAQNEEMATASRAGVQQIRDRTHMSIWTRMADGGDETSARILEFVKRHAGRHSEP